MEPDGGLAGRQPHDLDLPPADAADAEPEDLADRLLGRPATGHRLGPVAHVALLGVGQDAPREARAELVERRPDAVHLDDVDPELGRPSGSAVGSVSADLGSRAGSAQVPLTMPTRP